MALKVFRFQHENNSVYQEFCDFLKVDKQSVKSLQQIPFLPIQFFKSHNVVSNADAIQETFTSSGTTGMITSKHLITDVTLYEQSYRNAFSEFYGNIEDYAVLALLPSYLERSGSSLIYMVKDLIELSNNENSGFYLHNYDELIDKLIELDTTGQKRIIDWCYLCFIRFSRKAKIPAKKHHYHGNGRNERQTQRNDTRRITRNSVQWFWRFKYSFRIRNDRTFIAGIFFG